MTEPAIEVQGLEARYGDKVVLSEVDLRVERGEVRFILGGSGSGKTTLLKNLLGLATPAAGSVRLLGCDLTEATETERDALVGQLGMLFQGSALLNSMTVHENVALPLRERTPVSPGVVDEIVRMKLALVELEDAGHLFPSEISGGMKKRAGLARAMALDPAILFCDEPGAGLDPTTAAALDRLMLGLVESFGMTLVVVSHELASIERIAQKAIMLDGGHVVADGTLEQVKAVNHPRVRAFFFGEDGSAERPPSVLSMMREVAGP